MKQIIEIILSIVFDVLVIICWGFVSHQTYEWFVLSQIKTLPEFTILQFIGFNVFVQILTGVNLTTGDYMKQEYLKDRSVLIIMKVMLPWIVLMVSYFIHLLY